MRQTALAPTIDVILISSKSSLWKRDWKSNQDEDDWAFFTVQRMKAKEESSSRELLDKEQGNTNTGTLEVSTEQSKQEAEESALSFLNTQLEKVEKENIFSFCNATPHLFLQDTRSAVA